MARGLRRWLAKAGVKRHELHHDSETAAKLRFHDLRATGITWMAVRGDDALKIQRRAGHKDLETTQKYIRTAEDRRAAFGSVFPELPASLLAGGGTKPAPPAGSLSQELSQATQVSETIAGRTGLEPAASGVTGRRYNQLNYRPVRRRAVHTTGTRALNKRKSHGTLRFCRPIGQVDNAA